MAKNLHSGSVSDKHCITCVSHLIFLTLSYSWNTIRKTSNVTDTQLVIKFQDTALYAAVYAALFFEGDFDLKVLSPQQAAILPLWEELTSRFPGYSIEQTAALMRDYETEARILNALQVEDVFDRVKELALAAVSES